MSTPLSILASMKRVSLAGFSIAYQHWSRGAVAGGGEQVGKASAASMNVLCLHGWLDNSNSFSKLAPLLLEDGAVNQVVAIDLPGHGHSSHFVGPWQHIRHVNLVKQCLDNLGWAPEETSLVGHSMGGGIALLFAGTFPERLHKLAMIDAFGPYTSPPDRAALDLRKAIEAEEKLSATPKARGTYPTLGDAISARVRVVATYPGGQSISREAAELLVRRGAFMAEPVGTDSGVNSWESLAGADDKGSLVADESGGPVSFRYDQRLLMPSSSYLSVEQVDSFADRITCPVLLLQGAQGWPVKESDYANRKRILELKGLLDHRVVPGSHHLHLDPATSVSVANQVATFLRSEPVARTPP